MDKEQRRNLREKARGQSGRLSDVYADVGALVALAHSHIRSGRLSDAEKCISEASTVADPFYLTMRSIFPYSETHWHIEGARRRLEMMR